MSLSQQINTNLRTVLDRINLAAKKAKRDPSSIKLMLASKSRTPEEIQFAASELKKFGRDLLFGENYWQELSEKLSKVSSDIEFHFIGRLQSNKIEELIKSKITIQSVASNKHLETVKKVAAHLKAEPEIFLQVNASEDPKKAGFSIDEAKAILTKQHENVSIIGLMTIPELLENKEALREDFKKMRKLRGDQNLALSFGMSDDLEVAIEEGSDMVRIGTAIFGERQRKL